jgi:predicted enzyme related to lactoylglutathione lyase
MRPPSEDEPPTPYWLVYFGVDEIEAGIASVEQLGGTRHAGPIDIGIAKLAVVSDPQGAVFAIYAGTLEP